MFEGVLPGDPRVDANAVIQPIKRFFATDTAGAAWNAAFANTGIADLGTATTADIGAASALTKLIRSWPSWTATPPA